MTCATTTPCTVVQFQGTPGGQSAAGKPLPPPPPGPNGEAIGMWCPLGPLVCAGCSAAACVASISGTQGTETVCTPWGLHLLRVHPQLWGATPSQHGSTTCAEGSQAMPVTPQHSHLPAPSRTGMQLWRGWVACPCDVEVAVLGPHLSR